MIIVIRNDSLTIRGTDSCLNSLEKIFLDEYSSDSVKIEKSNFKYNVFGPKESLFDFIYDASMNFDIEIM